MMNSTAPGIGLILLWGLHIISIIVVGIGVALLLIWAFKHLSERGLWKWGWALVTLVTILCFLTISAWPSFGMMGNFGRLGYGILPMMGQGSAQNTDSAAQQKEEADGKILYDKLQAKQITCADVSDSEFELIGEFAMGQMAGTGHVQMNARIQQMMGKDGEEQMHIMIAKRVSGCAAGQTTQGMMNSTGSPQVNGGGMMGRFASSSSQTSGIGQHHASSISQ